MNEQLRLRPLLVCRDALAALDFYVATLGVRETSRRLQRNGEALGHADLEGDGHAFAITEEARAWNADAPQSLGGSPVVLEFATEELDALFARMVDGGATVVFGLQTFAGTRMGRLRDPFGHLWLLTEPPKTL